MRIGLLVAGFPPDRIGGAELQSRQLAEQLAAAGHDITVFTRKLGADRATRETVDGYRIRRRRVLPVPGLRLIWDTSVTALQVIRERSGLDVLLCYQTVNSGLIGIIAKSLSGIPAVISIRGNEEYIVRSSMLKRCTVRSAYRRASAVAVQTPLIEKELLETLGQFFDKGYLSDLRGKLHVVPNGINLPDSNPLAGTKILYVGRLIENKGVADLLSAVRVHNHLETVIVGDGPERSRLERVARGRNVTFAGFVDFSEIPSYLSKARMLVLPSRLGDGLPNVVLEAMACGVPVISTRSAGIPDIINDGVTGLLFEPGDTSKLQELIGCLASDDELHAEIRKNAQNYVNQYSWPNIIPKVEALLADAISSHQL